MPASIAITGPTGNVGSEIVKELLRQGISPRLLDHHPDRARALFGQQVEIIPFAFGDPATYTPALEAVEKLYLMRPPAITDTRRYFLPVIAAARQAGVKHIVFLSLLGVENNWFVPHYKIEQYLRASELAFTFLRPGFFMQNLSTTHRAEIRDQSEINVPAGRGKTSFIDVRDIAAVAALALLQPGHTGQAYPLTGSQALNYAEVAQILSQVLGRKITYRHPSIFEFLRKQQARQAPLPLSLVMTGLYSFTALGLGAHITGEVCRLLGREPISFEQFAQDNKAAW